MTSRPARIVAATLAAVAIAASSRANVGIADLEDRVSGPTLAAEEALRRGEPELAESLYRDAALEGWLLRGSLDVAEGQWDAAEEAFSRARGVVADPRRGELALSILSVRRGDPEAAVPLLRTLAARDPGDGVTRRLLSQVLLLLDRVGEAIQELEEAHREDPDDAETTFALASAYLGNEAIDDADASFAELLTERPGAPTHVLIGRAYLDHGYYDRAQHELQRALALNPEAPRANYYLGRTLLAAVGYDALEPAAERFQRELDQHPEDPLASLHLGLALTELRRCEEAEPQLERAAAYPGTAIDALRFLGKCRLAQGRVEAARDALERGLGLAEKGGRLRQRQSLHYQLGVALRRLGDPAAAEHLATAEALANQLVDSDRDQLDEFLGPASEGDEGGTPTPIVIAGLPPLGGLSAETREALRARTDRSIARAYANLGTLLARSSAPGRAADLFEVAADVDPELPGVRRSLGVTEFAAGRFAAAVDALERARKIQDDPDLRRTLALARLNLGDYATAADLLSGDPARREEPDLQYAYALSLVRSGRAEEADTAFRQLSAEHPDWPELHVLMGQARAAQGDFPGAEASLTHALELRPDVAEAHGTLGEIRMRQGNLEAAEDELRAELEHHPADLQTRYRLAVTLDLANESAAAKEQLELVLRARPDFADARYLLGKILLSENRPEEARAHLEIAASQAPTDANIAYQLSQALMRLGETEAGRAELARYRELKAAERGGG